MCAVPKRVYTKTGSDESEPVAFLLAESWGFEPQIPFWGILT